MKHKRWPILMGILLIALFGVAGLVTRESFAASGSYKILAWNDLGMHCYNRDFADLAVLPPYNNLWVQVVKVGDPPEVVTSGITVEYSYQDNTYSVGKTNFWTYDQALFGVDLPSNVGLKGKGLSGKMDLSGDHFIAEGIPVTEYSDSAPTVRQPYQLATVVVKDSTTGQVLTSTQVVTPVSSEMRCDNCHGDTGVAKPSSPTGKVETNILQLHDENTGTTLMASRPVLCAHCHGSNALGMPGQPGIKSLSKSMHEHHSGAVPNTLDGCYNCHPGPQTRCLRDVMFLEGGMVCTSCHGGMTTVAGNPNPWLNEPRCDACHNSGLYNQDQALYRFSKGHGGLYCEACHDSTHAIAKSREANDAIKFISLQGKNGPLEECSVCHLTQPGGEQNPHAVIGLGKAVLISPAGDIGANYRPTYTWNQVNNSTYYYLFVNGPSGNVIAQWYTTAQAACNGGTCSVTPGITLVGGAYTWWVRTWNSTGNGPWSASMQFSTTIPTPPAAATLVSPIGNIGAHYSPSYSWNEVTSATWYYLWINGSSGNIFKQWYEAAAVCNAGTCTVVSPITLGGGNYAWWVQTWNSAGLGPWSARMDFSTTIVVAPTAATLVSPSGDIGTNYAPTYAWNQVSGATWYYLWVNGPSGNVIRQWYEASLVCSGGACSATPATPLGGGTHTWWVQTWNSAGLGPWSAPMTFSTTIPTRPVAAILISPAGTTANHTPTYTWNQVSNATWYYLWVNGPGGVVIQQWYTSAQANCNGSTCSVTPAVTLTSGSHVWWIETWNSAGTGPWSAATSFTIQ